MEEEDSSKSPPLLLRDLIASVFILAADKVSRINFDFAHGHKSSKLLQLIRYVFVSSFLYFLRLFLVPSNPNINHHSKKQKNLNKNDDDYYQCPPCSKRPSSAAANKNNSNSNNNDSNNSGIGRALWQLLSLVNDIPVSSRKYQAVRSLAETIIHDNHKDGVPALRQVNRTVLSKAFSKTLCQLETAAAATLQQQQQQPVIGSSTADSDSSSADSFGTARPVEYRLSWLLRAVIRSICGSVAWITTWRGGRGSTASTSRKMSAEKLAAEVLWLAEKLAACGYGDEAVGRWASAANLAWLSLSIEPVLQASFVKVSALLFKHAKDMGLILDGGDDDDESKKEQQNQTKMKMLMSWLPLLCRASNGADVPVLSIGQRAELERDLEETIEMLEEEDQEKVLSLWLHHFTYCSSSDWPNLNACYARWCNASRKLLVDKNL